MSNSTFCSGTVGSTRVRVAALLVSLITFATALAVVNIESASAADRELSFTLDRGVINLGSTTGVKVVDPDLDPPDNPATLIAPLKDDGTFSAPKSAFTFPVKKITALETGNSFLPVVDAKIEISATADVTGTFDDSTGAGTMSVPARADITVYSAGQAASVAKCRVDGFSLDMETTGTLTDPATSPATDYEAAAFAPPGGTGAIVDNWSGLPNSTIVSGGLASQVCPAVDGLVGGPGGLWLSGKAELGGDVVQGPPAKAPKINTVPPVETNINSADFEFEAGEGEAQPVTKFQCRLDGSGDSGWEACDSGSKSYTGLAAGDHKFEVRAGNDEGYGPIASFSWKITGTEPCPPGTSGTPPDCIKNPEDKPKLAALKVAPKNKGVKRGKKATVTVKVKNSGTAAATGAKVCVTAPNKLVQVKRCVNLGQIAAGSTKTAKFKVTVKKKAKKGKKAVLKFKATTSNAGSKSGKATIKIK